MQTIVFWAVTIVLLLIIAALIVRLLILKSNIRQIRNELKKTRDEEYNRNIKIQLVDSELEKLAAEINENIDYQRDLKLQTARSKKQLEQSISDIAHDLRTPLTVIKGNLQMLEGENLSENGRKYMEISSKKAEVLKGMVDEFFELSVLESDSKPVELKKTDIIPYMSEFIIENETIIREKGLTPVIDFPEKSVYVCVNEDLLNRVFTNLISNTVKYAKGDFVIKVSEDKEKGCVVRIGNSVDDANAIDIEHIFDRTYRADKARSESGAGLGLYIAKLLMIKQKGNIEAGMEGDMLYFDVYLKQ